MHDKRALTDHRFGGFSLLLAGAMFLAKSILESIAGDPPSTGQEIQVWRSSHELTLVWVDETFFAATVLLVPAVIALYRGLRGPDRPWVDFGCGVFAAVIPVNVVLLIVHGRLVFPVFGIALEEPALAALVVSLYAGGTHAVSLLLAGAAVMLGLAMRRTVFGPGAGVVGFIAGAANADSDASGCWLLNRTTPPLPPREADSRNRNNTSTNKSAAQIKVVQSMESRHHAPMA